MRTSSHVRADPRIRWRCWRAAPAGHSPALAEQSVPAGRTATAAAATVAATPALAAPAEGLAQPVGKRREVEAVREAAGLRLLLAPHYPLRPFPLSSPTRLGLSCSRQLAAVPVDLATRVAPLMVRPSAGRARIEAWRQGPLSMRRV